MRRTFNVLVVAVLAAGFAATSATASDKTDVMATVKQFIDSFNKGDAKTAALACTEDVAIIDEFPPYAWTGAGSFAKWISDYDVDAKKNGITEGGVTLGEARHVDVAGNRAYVVIPADYAYKQNGKPIKQNGSILTLAMQKGEVGWRIAAWTWARH
jgi:ketosteroid isomerase-like protein